LAVDFDGLFVQWFLSEYSCWIRRVRRYCVFLCGIDQPRVFNGLLLQRI